jgi:hypothetical protein
MGGGVHFKLSVVGGRRSVGSVCSVGWLVGSHKKTLPFGRVILRGLFEVLIFNHILVPVDGELLDRVHPIGLKVDLSFLGLVGRFCSDTHIGFKQ